tara:strand:- start:107 stop:328 length:222 start_codon:yes stop_codon:yes gene_type:complete
MINMKQWQKDRLKGIEAQRLSGCDHDLLIDEYYQVKESTANSYGEFLDQLDEEQARHRDPQKIIEWQNMRPNK